MDYRQRLAKLDTCIVSDALDKLGLSGVAPGLQRLSTDARVVGPVLTVRLEEAKGRLADRHLCTAAIEAARPGEVIVVSGGARGVTAETVVAVAKAWRPRLVILGRSPEPAPEPEWLASLTTEDQIRQALIARSPSGTTPKAISLRLQDKIGRAHV